MLLVTHVGLERCMVGPLAQIRVFRAVFRGSVAENRVSSHLS